VNGEYAPAQEHSEEPNFNAAFNAGGNFPPMGWNGNATSYMAGMYNFPNSMGGSSIVSPHSTSANLSRDVDGHGPNGKSGDVR
jgi:hypothetical protein